MKGILLVRLLVLALLASTCGFGAAPLAARALSAQEITGQGIAGLGGTPRSQKGHVTYAAELLDVPAGKPSLVELRFRVDDGFHVNSHQPTSDLLIPTVMTLGPPSGIKVLDLAYPHGESFHLDIGKGETLDVYQGEFRLKLRLLAPKGDNTLKGELRYQACDRAACYPPRTLPVTLLVTGKQSDRTAVSGASKVELAFGQSGGATEHNAKGNVSVKIPPGTSK